MKKDILLPAFFLLATALAGCRAASDGTTSQPESIVPTPTSTQEPAAARRIYPLQGFGGYSYGTTGADGFYYVTLTGDAGGELLIHYIDYATMQDILLCAQPNCSHSDESCTAWLPYTAGGTTLMAVGDKLVLAYPGDVTRQEELGDLCLPHIEVANLDGSDRKPLLNFDASQSLESPYLTDGTNLFVRMTSVGSDGTGISLMRIDLDTGAAEPVVNLGTSGDEIVWGACGEYILLRRIVPIDNDPNILGGPATIYLDRLNSTTGERETILQWDSMQDRAAVFGSNVIVYYGETNTLQQIDVLSNTVVNTVENFLEPNVAPELLNLIYFDQNYLLASTQVDTKDPYPEQTVWHVDMASGEKTSSELYTVDSYTGRKIPYMPLAWIEGEQSYFVLTGEKEMEGAENSPYLNPTVPQYKMISFENFWEQ